MRKLGLPKTPSLHDNLKALKARLPTYGEKGKSYQLSLFEDMPASGFNGLERAVATFLDSQEQLFFWYRNRSRNDYFVQGRHLAGVKDTRGHLTDTGYQRDVFTLCTNLAQQAKWSELVPFMASRTMRFEVVDEEGWKSRPRALLAGEAPG